ncbi:MAG: hypothetical protein DMG05_11645 [Acidobacteria bacterium]|nr:MAG: hypothetical protein DMG05_11645 [Acidobacteriota bacterium]
MTSSEAPAMNWRRFFHKLRKQATIFSCISCPSSSEFTTFSLGIHQWTSTETFRPGFFPAFSMLRLTGFGVMGWAIGGATAVIEDDRTADLPRPRRQGYA